MAILVLQMPDTQGIVFILYPI